MVACLLQPLPKGLSAGTSSPNSGKGKRAGPYEGKVGTGKKGGGAKNRKGKEGKGKGTSKGKGKQFDRMPYALIGCKSRSSDGSKLCFDFNLPSGCQLEAGSGKCAKGVHACCGCLATSHGYQACTA